MDLMDYRRKIIANSPHLASASGAVASFSDGADLPLKSLLVDIEPVQSGSGDPSPTNVRPISGWNAVNVKNGNTVIATISLGQTVYGGTLNPLTGVLTVDRAYAELTKNSAWSWNSNNALVYCPVSRAVIVNVANQRDVLIKNNMFTNSSWVGRGTLEYACGLYFGASYVFVKSTNHIASLEDFKAIIGNNTLQVVYPLATPVEIQLTPQQIRSLYGNNTIFADTGNVALEYWAHP